MDTLDIDPLEQVGTIEPAPDSEPAALSRINRPASSEPINPSLVPGSDEVDLTFNRGFNERKLDSAPTETDLMNLSELGLMDKPVPKYPGDASIPAGKTIKAGLGQFIESAIQTGIELGMVSPDTGYRGINAVNRFNASMTSGRDGLYGSFSTSDPMAFLKYNLYKGFGQMLPTLAASFAAGGTSSLLGLGVKAATWVGSAANATTSFFQIYGNELESVRSVKGSSDLSDEALTGVALVSTIPQVWIEQAFGAQKLARNVLSAFGKQTASSLIRRKGGKEILERLGRSFMASTAIGTTKNAFGEAAEEVGQQWISDVSKWIIDPAHKMTPIEDYITQAVAAAPAGALFGTFDGMVDAHKAGMARRIIERTSKGNDLMAMVSRITPEENAKFQGRLSKIVKEAVASRTMTQDEAEAGVNQIARIALSCAYETGRNPFDILSAWEARFSGKGITPEQLSQLQSMKTQEEQLRFLKNTGLLDIAEGELERMRADTHEYHQERQKLHDNLRIQNGRDLAQQLFDEADQQARVEEARAQLDELKDSLDRDVAEDARKALEDAKASELAARADAQIAEQRTGVAGAEGTVGTVPSTNLEPGGPEGEANIPVNGQGKGIVLPDGVTPFVPGAWVPVDALPTDLFRYFYMVQSRSMPEGAFLDRTNRKILIPARMPKEVKIVPNLSASSGVSALQGKVTIATPEEMEKLLQRRNSIALEASRMQNDRMSLRRADDVAHRLGLAQANEIGRPSSKSVADQVRAMRARGEDGPVYIYRYSNREGVKIADPKNEGIGTNGAEASRRASYKGTDENLWVARTYWGGPRYREDGITDRPFVYRARVNSERLYDAEADPDGLIQKSVRTAASMGRPGDSGLVVMLFENNVRKAGYDGVFGLQEDDDTLIMFKPVKVEPVTKNGKLLTQANRKTQVSSETTKGSQYGTEEWETQLPYESRAEREREIQATYYNDSGEHVIAKALGLKVMDVAFGPGVYGEERNPSTHHVISTDYTKEGKTISGLDENGKLTPEYLNLVKTFAASIGMIQKQNSVGYHYADRDSKNIPRAKHNGIVLDVWTDKAAGKRRVLTPAEMDFLVNGVKAKLNNEENFASAAAPHGATMWNWTGDEKQYPAFIEAVRATMVEMFKGGLLTDDSEVRSVVVDGGLVEKGSDNASGQEQSDSYSGYLGRFGTPGLQSSLSGIQAAQERINAGYRQAYVASRRAQAQPGLGLSQVNPQVATPQFKKWFGNSVVKNTDGTPQVVYHGTAGDYHWLAPSRSGIVYVSTDPSYASLFANMRSREKPLEVSGVGPAVYPMFLKTEKPLDLTKFGTEDVTVQELVEEFKKAGVVVSPHYFDARLADGLDRVGPVWWLIRGSEQINIKNLVGTLKGKGFDSIKIVERAFGNVVGQDIRHAEDRASEAYITFDSSNLKSAVGNKGEFNAKDQRMLFQQQTNPLFSDNELDESIPDDDVIEDETAQTPTSAAAGFFTGGKGSASNVAVFFQTASADTLVHEFFHYMRTNELLPRQMMNDLLSASGEKSWTVKAEEFAANAMLSFIYNGTIPQESSAGWVQASIRARSIFQQYVLQVRKEGWGVNPELNALFSRFMGESDQAGAVDVKADTPESVAAQVILENQKMAADEGKPSVGLGQANLPMGKLKLFYASMRIYEEKSGKSAIDLMRAAGLKTHVLDSAARARGYDQGGDMTLEDLNKSYQYISQHPDVIQYTIRMQEKIAAKARAKAQKLSEMIPDALKDAKQKRREQSEAQARVVASNLNDMPDTEELRFRKHGGMLWKHRLATVGRRMTNLMTDLERLCNLVDGGDENGSFTRAVWNKVWKASSAHALRYNAATEFISNTIKALGGIPENMNDTRTIQDGAEKKQYTLSQLVGIYMHSQGGDLKSESTIALKEYNKDVTDNVIRFAVKYVETDPQAMNFVRAIQAYMGRVQPELAATGRFVLGRDVGNLGKFYLPFIRERFGNEGEIMEANGLDLIEGKDTRAPDAKGLLRTPSQIKKRLNIAGGRIEMDSLKLFLRYVESTENYIAKAPIIQDVLWTLSEETLADTIKDRHGADALNTITRLVSKEMSPTGRVGEFQAGEALLRSLRARATTSYLGLNPFVVFKQPIAILNAFGEISVTHGMGNMLRSLNATLLKINGFGDITQFEDYQRMIRESPIMRLRSQQSQLDPEFDNLMKQKYSSSVISKAAQSKYAVPRWFGRGLEAIRIADLITITAVYTTARDEAVKGGSSKEEAIAFAEKVVRKTQSSAVTSERTAMQSSHEFVRAGIMFSGQLFKNLNQYTYDIVVPIVRAARTDGTIGALGKAWELKRRIFYAVLLPSVVLGMIDRRRPQQDLKEFWLDLLSYPLASIPILGAGIASKIQGFDKPVYNAVWNDLGTAIKDAIGEHIKGDRSFVDVDDIWKDAKIAERAVLTATGVPQYPFRVANNLIDEMKSNGTDRFHNGSDFVDVIAMAAGVSPREKRAYSSR